MVSHTLALRRLGLPRTFTVEAGSAFGLCESPHLDNEKRQESMT
jgi:hypothetical protein